MAFFGGGLGGWKGSSWSPWSSWASGSDEGEDTSDASSAPAVATTSIADAPTQTPTPSPTPTPTQAPAATTLVPTSVAPTPTSAQSTAPKATSADPPLAAPLPSSSSSPPPAASSPPAAASSSQAAKAGTASQAVSSQVVPSRSADASNTVVPPSSSVSPSPSSPSSSSSSSSSSSGLPTGWEYYGCVPNSDGIPALNTTYATSDELTPALCVNACAASQYHFAGLLNGNSCFCGSIAVSYSTTSSTSCATACSGESSLTCGGRKAMSFYRLSPYDPTETFYANPTLAGQGGDLADVTRYLDAGSRKEIATMPAFTGSLIGAGSPHFKDSLHGVVFGQLIKATSSAAQLRRKGGGPKGYWRISTMTLVICLVRMIW